MAYLALLRGHSHEILTADVDVVVEIREGLDRARPGRGVLYFSRFAAKATSSRLNKVASLPEYKNMTLRSWSTTTKLLALMESRVDPRA